MMIRKITPHKGGRDFRPSLRLTRAEWEQIKKAASEFKLSVSDWMVKKAKEQAGK